MEPSETLALKQARLPASFAARRLKEEFMNIRLTTAATAVAAFGLFCASSIVLAQDTMSTMSADNIIGKWPADAAKAAKKVVEKYGQPDTASGAMLVWHNKGPYKRITATRTPDMHRFPVPHPDSMEQTVRYRVPVDKIDDLARFDGSVTVDRTRGEMAARCDLEGNNNLALNLAHDIVTGKRTVAEARAYYGRAIKRFKGKMVMDPYMKKITFNTMRGMTADPDKQTITVKM